MGKFVYFLRWLWEGQMLRGGRMWTSSPYHAQKSQELTTSSHSQSQHSSFIFAWSRTSSSLGVAQLTWNNGKELLWIAWLTFKLFRLWTSWYANYVTSAQMRGHRNNEPPLKIRQCSEKRPVLTQLWHWETATCFSILEVFFPQEGFHQGNNVARQLTQCCFSPNNSISRVTSLSRLCKLCHLLTTISIQNGNSRNSILKLFIFSVLVFLAITDYYDSLIIHNSFPNFHTILI